MQELIELWEEFNEEPNVFEQGLGMVYYPDRIEPNFVNFMNWLKEKQNDLKE